MLHKYLMARPRNQTTQAGAWPPAAPGNDSVQRAPASAGTMPGGAAGAGGSAAGGGPPDLEAMKASIRRYNEEQRVLNEDIFGPLQPDALIVVVQVSFN